jgi:hypothetical protein
MHKYFKSTGVIGLSMLLWGMLLVSCGRAKTERLLLNKKWEVYNVTPPGNTFNIEESNRAQELKSGFYRDAWFKFLPDSIFVASFGGKADTGRYEISRSGKIIALYPKGGSKMYEQMQLQQLTSEKVSFNTVIANFHMILHLKATGE